MVLVGRGRHHVPNITRAKALLRIVLCAEGRCQHFMTREHIFLCLLMPPDNIIANVVLNGICTRGCFRRFKRPPAWTEMLASDLECSAWTSLL